VTNQQLTVPEKLAEFERFMLDQAQRAGVIQEVTIKPARNPNRDGKKLAPWFSHTCR